MPPPVADDDHKRRARRRLIGAVALTLVAVIILPLVLEDAPPPAGPLEVHMPATAAQDRAPAVQVPNTIEYAPPAENTRVDTGVSVPATKVQPEPRVSKQELTQPKPHAATEAPTTAPEPAKPEPGTASPDAPDAGFNLQVGVFADRANVEKLKSRISALGLKVYTDQIGDSTRVRVGKFSSRAQAEAAAARLKEAGISARVVEK
jgi:DedD protein